MTNQHFSLLHIARASMQTDTVAWDAGKTFIDRGDMPLELLQERPLIYSGSAPSPGRVHRSAAHAPLLGSPRYSLVSAIVPPSSWPSRTRYAGEPTSSGRRWPPSGHTVSIGRIRNTSENAMPSRPHEGMGDGSHAAAQCGEDRVRLGLDVQVLGKRARIR